MKLIENITSVSVEELQVMLKENGISANRLDGAISVSYLPASGKFVFAKFDGYNEGDEMPDGKIAENNTRHIRLVTEKGEEISLSRLQMSGFVGEINKEIDIVESAKKTFYLRSNSTPNAFISGNQAAALKKLIGKSFTAEPFPMKRSKYVPEGFKDPADVKIVAADTYKITLT